MQITYLHIMNYKSISDLELKDIEDVLILVGRNSTGKSVVLDAIRVVSGDCSVSEDDFKAAALTYGKVLSLAIT